MVSLAELVEITAQELAAAVAGPVDELYRGLVPGVIFLQPITAVAVIGFAFIDFGQRVANNLAAIPGLVIARALIRGADLGESTQVCTIRQAKTFAAELMLGAVFELGGQKPPVGLDIATRAGALKGVRSRFIEAEKRQQLGKPLAKVLSAIRAPATMVIRLIQLFWRIVMALVAIGAVFGLYGVLAADWSKVALTQKRKRKRMTRSILRRV